MSFISRILESVVDFFKPIVKKLLGDTEDAFDDLTTEVKNQMFSAAQLSQIIKGNIGRSATYVVDVMASQSGVQGTAEERQTLAEQLMLTLSKYVGTITTDINEAWTAVQAKVTGLIDDNDHDDFFSFIGKIAATIITGGGVPWLALSLGLIELAYQKLKANGNLVQPITSELAPPVDTGGVPPDPTHPHP